MALDETIFDAQVNRVLNGDREEKEQLLAVQQSNSTSVKTHSLNTNVGVIFRNGGTSRTATCAEALLDGAVEDFQPYPTMTHCEYWVGESETGEFNHYGTYIGLSQGATWTSELPKSKEFYQDSSWSGIPIVDTNCAVKMRDVCDQHKGTPYPSSFVLWQYPMSVWPLRGFSGWLNDEKRAPAHCAALSARIMSHAFPEQFGLKHPSHWYGPSSLYLELTTPTRMKKSLETMKALQRKNDSEDETGEKGILQAPILLYECDELVCRMTLNKANKALEELAIDVLECGSRKVHGEINQQEFSAAQARYATGLIRYTWVYRK